MNQDCVHFYMKITINLKQFNEILIEFFVITFDWYTKEIILCVSFIRFSDVIPAFTCASTIVNLYSICLGDNVLIICVLL